MSSEEFQKLISVIESLTARMEEKFASLATNMEEKLASQQAQLDKLQQELAATAANQSSSSRDVMAKLNKRSYQFKRKGNEAQFSFNESVDEHIDAAKRQLERVPTTNEAAKQSLKRAVEELDQGKEAIHIRQKHIRIADQSDWVW